MTARLLPLLALVSAAALVAAGCTESEARPVATSEQAETGPTTVEQVETEPAAADTTGPTFVSAPVLAPNPNPAVPLAAVVRSETDEPAVIQLTIDDGDDVRVVVPDTTPRTEHETPVLELRPGREYTVLVEAVDEAGNSTSAPEELAFTPPPLPAGFPPIEVTQPAVEGVAEPGFTLFPATFSTEAQPIGQTFLVMVDGEGEVVWYYDAGVNLADARRLRNGNLLFLHSGNRGMREIDMLGNTVAEWTATGYDDRLPVGSVAVDTDSFHHEVYELPEGDEADFLVLSSELRPYPDYPTSETDPSKTEREALVMGDVVVAFRRDGTIVQEWRLLDLLDPYRMSYDSLDPEWQLVYGGEDTRDWSHGNAVVPDPVDGDLIVSLRNQDAVLKIDRETGELVWILAPHERWETPWSEALLTPPAGGDFAWSYHQHAPMFTPDGAMLLFDNGNARATPPDPELPSEERYSRLVEYRVGEVAETVSQTWAYGSPDDPWYSGALGDADYLPETGNVLAVDGFIVPPDSPRYARVFEVTHTDPAQVVFEIVIRDQSDDPQVGWIVYRAERLPSVYP